MSEFFCLDDVGSDQLLATVVSSDTINERVYCPVNPERHVSLSRRAELSFFSAEYHVTVRHNKRDHLMIWPWSPRECLVHSRLLAEMQSAEFTGYSVRPATVRFRDGFLSHEYQRLVITGWGGLARPESGIHLVEDCRGCSYKKWSPLVDPSQLIDRSQWTGEDFFIVWPLPNYTFVTERVAELFESSKVKNCLIRRLEPEPTGIAFTGRDGFIPGSLGTYLPAELALKFGKPLGIVLPDMEMREQ